MNPDAQTLWKAPRWALAVLLAVLNAMWLDAREQRDATKR